MLARMTLEDHAGDIVAKSRAMRKISPEDAATAAGWTPQQLGEFEQTGRCAQTPDWPRLGGLLDLNPARLERVAGGWVPEAPDLSGWRELRQFTTQGNSMSVHAYLVWDEVTREAAIFDTGFDPAALLQTIADEELNPLYLFITHMHGDHVAGLEAIRAAHPKIKVRTDSTTAPVQNRNRRNDFLHLGSLRVTNRDTPGHAEDGVTYIVGNFPDDAPNVAFVGDAIFAGSMGGAAKAGDLAKSKVREQILTLRDATLLCPGHGPLTTVGQEKANNPFF